MDAISGQQIVRAGHNCWRLAHADRAAFLIDGEAYFSALKAALEQATHSVVIIGWDIDSRIELVRDGDDTGLPSALGELLSALVTRRRELHVYVLTWDFATIYVLEREWLPVYKLNWRRHKRLHVHMDNCHPAGGCHHQKMVVIDDVTAFVGGFDLTRSRWDTPEHKAEDPRRVNPFGLRYAPFHDVQLIVEGDAAARLGELARERWHRATGRELKPVSDSSDSRWPGELRSDIDNVDVAIVRTQPGHDGTEEVHEVERLYQDAIAGAQRFIYMENQYFTSNAVGDALEQRLRERQGPEIVIVLPRFTAGWLEQATMDVLRARLLKRLRGADQYGRLQVYYPHVPGLDKECLCVHAKVMIVDDVLARVGSSNLSNRSMRLDTECDIAIEAAGVERIGQGIAQFRNRLLAEHLDVEVDDISSAIGKKDSLIAAIEELRGAQRTLAELDGRVPETLEQQLPESELIDPERPMDPERLIANFVPTEELGQVEGRALRFLLIVAVLIAMGALWRWTPLGAYLDINALMGWLGGLQGEPMGHIAIIACFVIGGMLAIPVTVMIVVTALIFGPFLGFGYSLLGSVLSAVLTYYVGELLGRDTVRRLGGSGLNKLSRQLGRRGLISIMTVRIVPVAPFTIVNLVAGASHISFRDFMLGTLLGMVPGLLAMTVFTDRLYSAAIEPNVSTLGLLAAVIVLIGFAAFGARRWLGSNDSGG